MVRKKGKKDEKEDNSGGMDLDDAFADDDVEYAESKPRKIKKRDEEDVDIEEGGVLLQNSIEQGPVSVKASKPIQKLKKGDKIRIDNLTLEVDNHYVLIDHGSTNEMAIEVFDPKTDKDYQIRYFSDQIDNSLDFYELHEIMYVKRAIKKIEF